MLKLKSIIEQSKGEGVLYGDSKGYDDTDDTSDSLVHRNLGQRSGPKKLRSKRAKRLRIALIAAGAIVLLAGIGFFAVQYKHAQDDIKRLSNPQEAAKQELQQVVARVSRLVTVPTNETPTLATVSDPQKLKGQSFFADAQKGDKVLIYTQSKRAILYRPSTDKVIESATVNIGNNTSVDTPAATPTPTPTAITKPTQTTAQNSSHTTPTQKP